jgi:predicted lipoprotein with Yx(FWY)xxD motif
MRRRILVTATALAVLAAVAALAVETTGGSTHHAGVTAQTPANARAVGAAEEAAARVAVATRVVSGLGRVLVSATGGRTLYAFLPDAQRKNTVTCKDACATFWVPLKLAAGQKAPVAVRGARRSLVGSVRAPGGGRVATYAGRPLYEYQGDIHGGIAKGQGALLPEPCSFLNLDCSLMLAGPVSYAVNPGGTLNRRRAGPDALGP